MSPGELSKAFRTHAAQCIEIATELPDPQRRAAVLTIAQTWFALADRVDRNGGVILGVSLVPHQTDKI